MKNKYCIILTAIFFCAVKVSAQSVVVTDDNTYVTGQASSVLDVKSTAKGFLAPRMTSAQRNAITSPADGLLVYQTDGTKGFYYYNASSWTILGTGIGSQWTTSGNAIYYNTGNVGVGVSNPTLPLVVKDTMEIRRVGSLSELLFTNTIGSGDFRIGSDGGNMYLQSGGGRNLQMGGFGGIVFSGDRQVTAFPAYTAAGSNTNVLALAQRDASVPLAVQANSATQTANLMEWRSSAATLNVVDKSGNFGIGVTAPTSKLHVAGTNPLTLNGVQTGALSDSLLTITAGIVRKLPFSSIAQSQWTTSGNNIYFNTGNVGVGVNNPTLPLVVKDTLEIRRVGAMSELLFTNTSGAGDLRIAGDGGDLFWQGGGGRNLQMGAYWGLILAGDRQTTAFPAFSPGTGNTNVLALAQRDVSVPLAVQGNSATQSANLMEWRSSAATLDVVNKDGDVGIGVTSPTASLHLKAGTATATTAPLKFTAGTNMTTAETGAVEFDGTNYFVTTGTTRYTLAKTLTATATIDFPSTPSRSSSDIAITLNGAVSGDVVLLGVSTSSVLANSCYTAFVSAANTVTVRFSNYQTGSSNPTSGIFRVTIVKY